MKYIILSLFSTIVLLSCTQQEEVTEVIHEGPDTDIAVAVIHPTEGNSVEGTVIFTKEDDGVRVRANISGLGDQTLHGFHIHQYGDCRASDGTSAAGHFDPEDMPHGAPTDAERHIGDLGNLPSNEDGDAEVNFIDPLLTLSGNNSIIGRGVIIHAGEDDLVSQPTGDAGARLGCGVIGVANPDY